MRLLLLRHAKSGWGDKSLDDHDRPLSERGRGAASLIGRYMRAKGHVPQRFLCSSATRTRQTLELVLPYLSPSPEISYTRALYLAEPERILELARETAVSTLALLVIGHNPGLERAALALSAPPANAAERERIHELAQKFPPCALAVFDLEGEDWRGLYPGKCRLIDYVRPQDLAADLAVDLTADLDAERGE